MSNPAANGPQLAVTLLSDPAWNDLRDWEFSPDQTVRIGRSRDSDVQLLDPKISRTHATMCFDGNDWVCDCVGNNGTFQAGTRVSKIVVVDGTVLDFAESGPRLHFRTVDTSSEDSVASVDQSVAKWVESIASGDKDAATDLWAEFFPRVVEHARFRMASRHRRATDEEDVAVSVFDSLYAGMASGKFPDLKDRESLWRLLCFMTRRKVGRHVQHERRQKRGGGLVRGESVFGEFVDGDAPSPGFDHIEGDDATSEFQFQLVEETERLFELLGEGELRRITELKLAEHTNEEIAEMLGCHVRTVKRRLQTIRSILGAALTQDD